MLITDLTALSYRSHEVTEIQFVELNTHGWIVQIRYGNDVAWYTLVAVHSRNYRIYSSLDRAVGTMESKIHKANTLFNNYKITVFKDDDTSC